MVGILTEKPSACRNFSKALGGMSGNYNGESYVLAHAAGHLYELLPPSEQVPKELEKQYRSWDTSNLPWNEKDFTWKKKATEGSGNHLSEIRNQLMPCDEIVIATDNDPSGEGDLLAWEILKGLHLDKKKITRMYFEDESEREIRKAFGQRKIIPQAETDPAYKKAVFRSKWDFLSMQFTELIGGKAHSFKGGMKAVFLYPQRDSICLHYAPPYGILFL